MTNINLTRALPRSKPSAGVAAGFAACVRPFAVVMQSAVIGKLDSITQLGHESSDYGHNAQCKQGVIRGGLSM